MDFLKDDLSKSLEYDQVKNDLEQIELEEVEGIILRAGIRWRELGEKSTKYFFGLEKRNAAKKHIRCIKDDSGKMFKDTVDILYILGQYYQNLYKEDSVTNNPNNSYDSWDLV